jgi:secondary thiamine-phosphate synthase enzyme
VQQVWVQRELKLVAKSRGFHLITDDILQALPELGSVTVGLLHVFIKHSSASLSVNENADPTVRQDFEQVFSRLVPENQPYYQHNDEGPDDLPAHIKASLLGSSVSLPVTNGRLNIGVWQGIYFCEHRNRAGGRQLVLTLQGQSN